uniref:Protein kinase domain-containing protein n=2 Tax=Meloidogyne TaxID=189290 RepID=A0A6V7VPL6_MELEN|nr:unnamed protein product [Meloidogyne enterolobii]
MDTDNIQIPAGISKFGRIWIVSSLIRRIRIFIGGEAIRMSGFTTKYFYKRIKFSVIVTTPLSSQQRPSSFSTINSVPAARRPIYNQFVIHCSFIAMELKGRDLYRLRKDRNNGSFTLGTAVRVALVTLEAIRELHEVCGFISRDIKAGNFVTGQTTSDDIRNIYLIDFGLCRKYKDANNNIVVARPDVGWRGTTRYGSRSAHLHQDLARRDDVESWFYMIVEMTKGSLPWSAERDRAAVYKSKLAALSNLDDFLNGCPQGYRELIGPIIKLNFGDAPAYKEMGRVLERIITEQGIDKKGKMDWELAEEPEVAAEGEQQLDSFPTSTTQRRV